jgi:hypothetical protein
VPLALLPDPSTFEGAVAVGLVLLAAGGATGYIFRR